jgi:hypothetical protein
MTSVSAASVAAGEASVEGLPARVQEALDELAGAAREGLLALSVGVGLGVMHELMEAEVVRHEALSTNSCESMIETVRRISRNVKRWQNGDMCLR